MIIEAKRPFFFLRTSLENKDVSLVHAYLLILVMAEHNSGLLEAKEMKAELFR